jgi:cobalt-precorrin-7 (C5)-methyltransferase
MEMTTKKVYLLGCGPGAPDYVTPIVSDLVRQCSLMVGSPRTLALFPESKAERLIYKNNIEELLRLVTQRLDQTDRIAWLCTGDTGLSSIAAIVQHYLGADRCIVLPGISSIQIACARLGIDWSNLRVISAHGVIPCISLDDSRTYHYALLAGTPEALPEVRKIADTLKPAHRLFVCEELTLPKETIKEIEPEGLSGWISHPRTLFLWIAHDHKE